MNQSKRLARIFVPIAIVVVILVIWGIKTQQKQVQQPDDHATIPFELTKVDLNAIKAHGLPVLLDFGSESCQPCQVMAPALAKFYEDMQGKAIVHYTDVWKYPENGADVPLQVIPTQLFINADGTPYVPSDQILNSISGFQMYSLKETNEHVYTVHQGGLTEEQMHQILAEMGVKP